MIARIHPALSLDDRSRLPNRRARSARNLLRPPTLLQQNSATFFVLSSCRATELSRVRRLGSGEAAIARISESGSTGSKKVSSRPPPATRKNGPPLDFAPAGGGEGARLRSGGRHPGGHPKRPNRAS